MNLLIVTHYLENYKELADITNASKDKYAQRHGYDFFVQEGNYCEWGFDYQRIQLIYDLFFQQGEGLRGHGKPMAFRPVPDVIWWTGCDVSIITYPIKVTDFLKPEDKSFYIHADVNGLNNDSFLIRRTEWSKKWLEFIMSLEPAYRDDPWVSQRAMMHNYKKDEWKDGIQVMDFPGINDYFYDLYNWPETTPGHFQKGKSLALHLPGCNLKQRLEIFRSQRVKDLIVE